MAVGFDAKMTGGNSSDGLNQEASSATSISSAAGMTVGASATLLIAMLAWGASSGTPTTGGAMTWNGVSMSAGPSILSQVTAWARVFLFYLINPAPGTKTLAGSWTTTQDCYMSAVSFTGTDTSTGIAVADNTTATQATTITIPSTTDGATVAVFAVDGSTPTVNFTKIWAEAPLAPGGGGNYALGGTSNGHTFTGAGGTRQALAGVHILAGGGGGGPVINDHNFRKTRGIGAGSARGVCYAPEGRFTVEAYNRERERAHREFMHKVRRAA